MKVGCKSSKAPNADSRENKLFIIKKPPMVIENSHI